MCRWLAYSGAPIYLDEALFKTDHSLIDQSLHARQSASTTNGDGFGVGWYGNRETPGVYRDIHPAWNDSNLKEVAAHIESGLFLAHIRAATGTPVQRTNCHPFRHRNWLFVHNGAIRSFQTVKRDLVLAISPERYGELLGSTDSEIMFHLALTHGLAEDVMAGVAGMVGVVEQVGHEHGVEHPLQMTLGISDGASLYAFRYSSEGESRSLFYSADVEAISDIAPNAARFSDDARAIVSEPLSDLADVWIPVPESSCLTVNRGDVRIQHFEPNAS